MYCPKCGTQNADGAKFCTSCGQQLDGETHNTQNQQQKFEQTVVNLNNTSDYTGGYSRQDIEQNKVLALFAYLGILFLIPLCGAPNSPYARFHSNQGIVLFIAQIVYGVASAIINIIFGDVPFIGTIISIALWVISLLLFILVVIGIVNAVQGRAKELPIIGTIRILK